jgi:hypothetical protein
MMVTVTHPLNFSWSIDLRRDRHEVKKEDDTGARDRLSEEDEKRMADELTAAGAGRRGSRDDGLSRSQRVNKSPSRALTLYEVLAPGQAAANARAHGPTGGAPSLSSTARRSGTTPTITPSVSSSQRLPSRRRSSTRRDDTHIRGRSASGSGSNSRNNSQKGSKKGSLKGGSGTGGHGLSRRALASTLEDYPLPFTVGKSTSASFSIPVNVQEILAKQPLYLNEVSNPATNDNVSLSSSSRPSEPHSLLGGPSGSSSTLTTSTTEMSLGRHAYSLTAVIVSLERELKELQRRYAVALEDVTVGDEAGTTSKLLVIFSPTPMSLHRYHVWN